jgi:hypothetical protein
MNEFCTEFDRGLQLGVEQRKHATADSVSRLK